MLINISNFEIRVLTITLNVNIGATNRTETAVGYSRRPRSRPFVHLKHQWKVNIIDFICSDVFSLVSIKMLM